MANPNILKDDYRIEVQTINDLYNDYPTAIKYLVQFNKETKTAFRDRQKLSMFTNLTKEAVDTISNIIMRKPPDYTDFDKSPLADFKEEIDGKVDMDTFIREVITHTVRDGFCHILVEKGVNKEDRPYFILIPRLSFLNEKADTYNNFTQFTYKDYVLVDVDYDYKQVERINCYIQREDGYYLERWIENKQVENIKLAIDVLPIVKIFDSHIPYYTGLAQANIVHFNLHSQQLRDCRKTSPIPIMYNFNSDDKELTVGVESALKFTGTKSESGFEWSEPEGKNITTQSQLLKEIEDRCREIMVKLIKNDITQTATEMTMQNTDNEATISKYALKVQEGINKALYFIALYQGLTFTDTDYIKLNTDYNDTTLDANHIKSYLDMYTQGVIDKRKLIDIFIKGEVLDPMDTKEIDQMVNSIAI